MTRRTPWFVLGLSIAAAACGGSLSDDAATRSQRVTASVTTSIAGPGGATVTIPAGSLDADTTITVSSVPSARRPSTNAVTLATPLRLGPEGQTFHHAVEVVIPIDLAGLPADKTIDDVIVLRAPQGTQTYVPLPTRRRGASAVVAITEHFSDFVAVVLTGPGTVAAGCGDAMCMGGETCSTCAADCGLCLAGPECGNTKCEANETCATCEFDCGCSTPVDAGTPVDGGTPDAGSPFDSGLPFDAGFVFDAGGPFDAGPPALCFGATAPANGSVSSPMAIFPDFVTYDCDPGFSVAGSLTSQCQANGFFDSAPPTCVPTTTTVYVATTGLEWERTPSASSFDWAGAVAHCDGLSLGGRDDWRLPTRRELATIVDYSVTFPSVNGATFPGTASTSYFTATSAAPVTVGHVWALTFTNGQALHVPVTDMGKARCVRTSVPLPSGLVDNADGTVTDTLSGLQWQQVSDPGLYTQPAGVSYCSALVLGGYPAGAWRLPSITELESLLDLTRASPAIDPTFFPGEPIGTFWTSSVNPDDGTGFWGVLFSTGEDTYVFATGSEPVRCVH